MFLRTLYIVLFGAALSLASPENWKTVEMLMEENPYIAALLNHTFDYLCTGTVISKKTVLTSGTCVNFNPTRVTAGVAVVGRKTSKSSIVDVAFTRLHGDYNFEMKAAEPNITRMHSNIGLVIVVRPMLHMYIPVANIGHYYAPELQDIELTTVGFGTLTSTRNIVLQYANYNQAPCANPRWYYCICGIEATKVSKSYENNFGNGAPVLFGNEVVGVSASASGKLYFTTNGVKYNVFTVIGPYLAWIEKADVGTTLTMRALSGAVRNQSRVFLKLFYIFLLLNKMYN